MPTALAKLLAKRLGEKYRALFHGGAKYENMVDDLIKTKPPGSPF